MARISEPRADGIEGFTDDNAAGCFVRMACSASTGESNRKSMSPRRKFIQHQAAREDISRRR